MKKLYTLLFAVTLFTLTAAAQTTVSLVLDSNDEDATIDNYVPANNYPNGIDYTSRAWTINGTPVTWRSVFKFNLQCIPSNAIVSSAYLSLFWADTNGLSNGPHQSLTSSDESVLQRVTSQWTENSVNWDNQPSSTTTDEVILPQSITGTDDYLNNDVTAMVQQMVSGTNDGFMLKLTNETFYAQMIFASGDNPHPGKRPVLTVTYTVPSTICLNLTLNSEDEDANVDNYVPANNYPNGIDYTSRAWTINGTPVTWRDLFKFNLQCIPSNAIVSSAYLSLFWADTNSLSNSQHQSLTSSDESVLQRVTSSWTENTVNWNNQPAATATDQVILPQSTSGTQDYLNNDVTAMVQQMVSGTNDGFLLKLTNETFYAQMIFASGDNPHSDKHPLLQVCYTVPTGINEISNENGITVFPDPATDEVTIKVANQNEEAKIELFNATGQKVGSWQFEAGNKEIKLNVKSFAEGIYFIKVSDGNSLFVKKLMIGKG
jgi:hypothetical protein